MSKQQLCIVCLNPVEAKLDGVLCQEHHDGYARGESYLVVVSNKPKAKIVEGKLVDKALSPEDAKYTGEYAVVHQDTMRANFKIPDGANVPAISYISPDIYADLLKAHKEDIAAIEEKTKELSNDDTKSE